MNPDNTVKLHYYAFSFQWHEVTNKQINIEVGSAYIGYPEPVVSVPRIQGAKQEAKMPAGSVLVGLGYMGLMTPEEAQHLQ